MYEIFNLLKNKECPDIGSNHYLYNNTPVPRVSEIISKMIHEDYLMDWANAIGLFKHTKYKDETDKACFIGTYTHNLIEQYINEKLYNIASVPSTNNKNISSITNGVESFKLWYKDISEHNTLEIKGIEQQLVCPWFGGTYDLLLQINKDIYLVDFKTSNYITYKYFLQLAAYKWMLKFYYNIEIQGCLLLQVDKKVQGYEEYLLHFDDPIHLKFIDDCTNTFLSLVYSYYGIINCQQQYNNIFKRRS